MPVTLKNSNPVTRVALLIDSSGSMGGRESAVIKNVNAVVDSLKKKAEDLGQEVFVSLYSFDSTVTNLVKDRKIATVPKLDTYRADGATAFFDAIVKAADDLKQLDTKDTANLITVITDGEESGASRNNGYDTSALISKLTATDRWTFSFLVPNGYTREITNRLSAVPEGNVTEWDTSSRKGLDDAAVKLSSGYAGYLGLRSTGGTSSKGFFLGINSQQAKAVKKNLDDVRADFKDLTVRTQDPKVIKDFIEARGLTFMKGRAFYQLTKPETIQNHKEVLMRELKTGAIYGGAGARQILGLPDWQDVKVKPEDHGDWEIFVQSTSNNRKLMTGTKLLYLK